MSLFHPFRAARRARILSRSPIADELWDWALVEHRIFRWLSAEDTRRLRELATVFLGEKRFDPVGGLVLEEETKVSIAAQACLPLLGLEEGLDWYADFSTIIVTEKEYGVRKRDVDEAGVVHEYDDEFAGEAFELGPVALSRADVEASGWGDGYNVVIHEMAHKLDARNGDYDGAPPLRPGMSPAAWQAAFKAAYEDLRTRLEAPSSRKPRRGKLRKSGAPRIDAYAAEGPDEFFAVACEYFYERPELLRQEYPAVYEQLVLFFARDPAARGSVEA
jgi:Mlc titration factor MtfA (ptsG expression regulator)